MSITVYAPGCWDLFHYGHLKFLGEAKKLGNYLVVGVASDEVILEDKGRLPIIPVSQRLWIVDNLKIVDDVSLYSELDFIKDLELYKPNVLAVGEFWGKEIRHRRAEDWIRRHEGRIVKIPYTKSVSTTLIVNKILAERKYNET